MMFIVILLQGVEGSGKGSGNLKNTFKTSLHTYSFRVSGVEIFCVFSVPSGIKQFPRCNYVEVHHPLMSDPHTSCPGPCD